MAASPDKPPNDPRPRRGAIQVYETLRDDILWLRIEPGTAIDELALARRFEISRTPIREALMLLAGDDLVVFLPNRTTIVVPLSLHNTGAFMDMYLLLSRAVVRGVILNHDPGNAPALEASLADVVTLLEDAPGELALRADIALRRLLGDLARNTFQNKYYRQILDAGVRTRILHFFPNSRPQDLRDMQQFWQALIGAIRAGDPDTADRIITDMILTEGEVVLRSLRPRLGHLLPLSTLPLSTLPLSTHSPAEVP